MRSTILGVSRHDRDVAIGQELGVVIEIRDRVVPLRGQFGVDRGNIRLAQSVASQVDLQQRVTAQHEHRRHLVRGS